MASTKDIHDILGMGGAVQKPASKKKKKVVETQPRLSGISREVQALMGDSVPPVQIVETPKYKSKPTLASKFFKPRHWEQLPFKHGARADALELRHWKRAIPSNRPPLTNGDAEISSGNTESEKLFEEEFPMEKWDVRIRIPQFTEGQYEKYFKSEDWSREETDYLMELASDYDLRWMLIADRYDPQAISSSAGASSDGTDIVKDHPERSMEQMKVRYYEVAAQDLELRIPKTNMTQAEFHLWEKMRNFDAKTETQRKATAEKLFERTKEDAEEERALLEELNRITKNEEDFIAMRKDLYARLEAAPSLRRNERGEEQNIVLSSAGLSDLLNRLFSKERAFKRRIVPNGEVVTNAQASNDQKNRQPGQLNRRDTLETPAAEKKGSVSQPVIRQLSKVEEEKYGVTHAAPGERLTSGVSFRHEKINRITTAKSQVQTQKINAALVELEIPVRLSMPTDKVCKEFERLVGQIQLLLEARKTSARVSEETKTLEEMRRQRLGEPSLQQEGGTGADMTNGEKVSTAQAQNGSNSLVHNASEENDEDLDEGEPGPAVGDDDEDEEGENDATNMEQTRVEDDDDEDEDEDAGVDELVANKDDVEDEEEEDEEEDEEGPDEDDDEGTAALRRGADNDDEEEEDDEEEHEPLVEEGDEDEEDEEDEANMEATQNGAESDEDEDEDEETQDIPMPNAAEDEDEENESGPISAAGHKRGASTLSDASGDGSNRSGISRKRKR